MRAAAQLHWTARGWSQATGQLHGSEQRGWIRAKLKSACSRPVARATPWPAGQVMTAAGHGT